MSSESNLTAMETLSFKTVAAILSVRTGTGSQVRKPDRPARRAGGMHGEETHRGLQARNGHRGVSGEV